MHVSNFDGARRIRYVKAVASGGRGDNCHPPPPQCQQTIFLKRPNLRASLLADLFLSV